ncbi:MAG: MazG nucleotide pyrophosphohydrolase domain-containing protein [Planctomycetia bacterium]
MPARRPRRARTARGAAGPGPTLRAFQRGIEATYGARDRTRGLEATFMWLAEEVGELSRALRSSDRANLREEFADVLAWLATLASLAGIDLSAATERYAAGCPRCSASPCACRHRAPQATGGPHATGGPAARGKGHSSRPKSRRSRASRPRQAARPRR